MQRKINVCRYCEDRYPACHDHCPKYKEAYERETEILNKARRETLGDREHLNYLRQDKEKRRRKYGL